MKWKNLSTINSEPLDSESRKISSPSNEEICDGLLVNEGLCTLQLRWGGILYVEVDNNNIYFEI